MIQRRLESLRIERIRTTKSTFLLAPLLWTPFCIVAVKGLLDLDVYAVFPALWLGANVIFGLVVLAVGFWIIRLHASRMEQSSLVRQLLRDIAGQNLNAAMEFLRSLSEFEDEEAEPA